MAKRVADAALRRDGVINARAEAASDQARRPIGEHSADWQAALEAKGNGAKRVKTAFGRAQRMVASCEFATLGEIDPAGVTQAIRRMQENDAAPRTINGHLQAFKQFIRWAVAGAGWP